MTTPYDPEEFRAAGHRVVDLLADHLAQAGAPGTPVLPWAEPAEQQAYWAEKLGSPSEVPGLLADVIARSHHLHAPRYMGHQVSVPAPMTALADLVSSVLNNGMAVYEMGPVGFGVERACVRWMCDTLGLGPASGGLFTSGGSLGNLTALLAARRAKAPSDVWKEGARDRLAVLVSEHAHYCVARAVQIMGWGEEGVVPVRTDGRFRVTRAHLDEAHAAAAAAGRTPIAVVASCCTTSTGSYDPIPVVADFAEANDLWLHVDGAHGASAAVSPALRGLVAGIDRADSVVWDAHKLLGVPSLSTAVLYKNDAHAHEAFSQRAAYLLGTDAGEHWWDGAHRTIECTRRMLALPLYQALATYGIEGLASHVETLHTLAQRFARRVASEDGFELALEPESNIVCFRFAPPGTDDPDALQDSIRDSIVRSGRFYLVRTQLPSGVFLRVTLMNPRTTDDDTSALLEEIRRAASSGALPPR